MKEIIKESNFQHAKYFDITWFQGTNSRLYLKDVDDYLLSLGYAKKYHMDMAGYISGIGIQDSGIIISPNLNDSTFHIIIGNIFR